MKIVLLAVLAHTAAGISLLRGSHQATNATAADVVDATTAWDSHLMLAAGSAFAPHAGNDECSAQLGQWWSLPLSDISVRHNLIPGATVIFEVGGNIGEDLQQYVWKFPQAKIYSFEPVPELFTVLQQKFGSNPNVMLQKVGVSNSDRMTTFTVGGNHGEGSSHTNTTAVGQTISVQLRDANALLSEVQQWTGKVPDVVSINCEGCEYDTLSRMAQTGWLGKVPFVQMSWHLVGGVTDRLTQRCNVENVLWQHYTPAYHALYGWQGWKLKGIPSFLQEDDVEETEDIEDERSAVDDADDTAEDEQSAVDDADDTEEDEATADEATSDAEDTAEEADDAEDADVTEGEMEEDTEVSEDEDSADEDEEAIE